MNQISDIKVARSDKDREQIFRFRYDVYVTEMGKSPAEADHDKKIIRDELDNDAHLLYAEDEGQIVGTVRLNCRSKRKFPAVWEQRYDIEKFAPSFGDHISMTSRMMVAKDYRGSSVPAALVGAYTVLVERWEASLISVIVRLHCLSFMSRLAFVDSLTVSWMRIMGIVCLLS